MSGSTRPADWRSVLPADFALKIILMIPFRFHLFFAVLLAALGARAPPQTYTFSTLAGTANRSGSADGVKRPRGSGFKFFSRVTPCRPAGGLLLIGVSQRWRLHQLVRLTPGLDATKITSRSLCRRKKAEAQKQDSLWRILTESNNSPLCRHAQHIEHLIDG